MHRLMSRALLVFVYSALAAACGGDSTPAPTLPTGPPPTVTETITGDINRNGAFTQPFLAGASGDIRATLDSLGPEDVTAVGVSLGTWNGSACQVIIANDNAVPGAIVFGQTSVASNLCLRVYDVGKITERASYQITLVHP